MGPPPGMNWPAQWHDMLHEWNCVWITGPVPVEFLLLKDVYDSILELYFSNCKFTRRTLGEESACVESTSNMSVPFGKQLL